MKRIIFFSGILILTCIASSLFTSCNSCSNRKAHDVSSIPGAYRGEATIVLPEHVKAMLVPDANGNTLVPDGPIPCTIVIEADTSNSLTLRLADFVMPVRGITVNPAKATVTQTDTTFNIKGSGNVSYGTQKISYTHEGKVKNDELDLSITVSIIPVVVEPKIIFKGKK